MSENDNRQSYRREASDRGSANDRGNTDRGGAADRGYGDRGYDRGGVSERGYGDRGYDRGGVSERGNTDRGGAAERGYGDRGGAAERGYGDRGGAAERGYGDRGGAAERGYGDRGGSDRREYRGGSSRYDNDNQRRNGGYGGHGGSRGRGRYSSDRNYNRREEESSYNIEEKLRGVNLEADPPVEQKPITAEDAARREEYTIPITTFDELGKEIDLKIIRGVMAYGFELPSQIQQRAIRPVLGGYDVIAQAQSGMGKTATFCIGALGRLDLTKNEIQVIVLAHTLELAMQIEYVFKNIGRYLDVRIGMATKSIPVRENVDQLLGRNTEGNIPHVVIGTPGRVLDMLNKDIIHGNSIKLLILDEADELLSDGFLNQIKSIIGTLNREVQIGLFSATMEPDFFKTTRHFMRNPMNILIKKEELTLEGIKQFYIDCEKNEYKFETLCDLYSLISVSQTIIYCNHYQSVEQLTRKLQENNFKVSCIHGNMDIAAREEAMKNFRSMVSRVLISTDLLGRGIDVQQVSVVINYDLPLKIESYIHRIGRSGRHGRKGTAINLLNGHDFRKVKDIERYYNTHIEQLPDDVASILA
jgi:translation initiation factor 4A